MRISRFHSFFANWREELLPVLWKILLAVFALADITSYWPYLNPVFGNQVVSDANNVCKNKDFVAGETDIAYKIGLVFGLACIIEAFLRARAARLKGYENAMLDEFERKLKDFYSSRASVWHCQENSNWEKVADDTIRIWIPCASVFVVWFLLMPWWTASEEEHCFYPDNAPITLWISYMVMQWNKWSKHLEHKFYRGLRKYVRKMLLKPRRLISEIRRVLHWIRLLRFAGPFIRMSLKLQDQFWDLFRTWRRNRRARAEKEKRVNHRSLLKLDLKRIASYQRVQASLQRVKSQFFREQTPSEVQQVLENRVGKTLKRQKKRGLYIERKLEQLQTNTSATWGSSSAIYDQFVNLTRNMSSMSKMNASGNRKHNKDLIVPNNGFTVIWRVVISSSLMLELFRLLASWRQKGDFSQPLPEVLQALMPRSFGNLIESNATIYSSSLFTKTLGALQFLEVSDLLSKMLFRAGIILQHIIDMVCFLDIFVWYYTGLLEPDGIVVAKPFFSRSILPGTLSQVLDHPTLPSILPSLLWRGFQTVQIVGYGRAIRWCLALYPVMQLFLFQPLANFLFCPSCFAGTISRRDTFAASFVY
mmetsp:Transcript_28281/g.41781  ORF Transcript_28281/g.41781 Transcript_28281/m.41781 type:complete len:590 (+) Transcript_28281:95-1864(+)